MKSTAGTVLVLLLLSWMLGPLAVVPHGDCEEGPDSDCCEADCAMCFCCVHWLPVLPVTAPAPGGILRTFERLAETCPALPAPHPYPVTHVPKV